MLEIQDFRDFSVSNWYEKFKHVSLETILIKLPDSFIEKFRCDEEITVEDFPVTLREQIETVLNALDKGAFIKNNWHAPTDARIFSFGNNLKASSLDDIILYLTSSVIIRDDFENIKGVPFYLVLRKWINIHPAAEFRCIIINNVLRGITPRDWPTYYAYFKEEGPQIIEKITKFYDEHIKLKFPRLNYVVDIVFSYPDIPYVLDFGLLNNKTNLYAFNWKEIQPLLNKQYSEDIPPVFRFLETDIGIIAKSEALRTFTSQT